MFNCQVKKSDPIKVNSETQSAIKKVNSQKTISEIDKEFLINDENVMEFFLEYDKLNKENKVRIYTDYGIIDIRLFEETKFHRSNFIYLTKKIFR